MPLLKPWLFSLSILLPNRAWRGIVAPMQTGSPPDHFPFDRNLLRKRRDRAARSLSEHDFLFAEAAERLADRLDDVRRNFPLALDLGCRDGVLARALRGRGGIAHLIQSDLSPALARKASALALAADEEFLPFRKGSFDLALSCLSLHWANDLPGVFLQLRQTLKPGGMLLVSLLGGETLTELRRAFLEAEAEVEGGAGIRVSPFADVRDLGALAGRAGFIEPVVDSETLTVRYEEPMRLLADLSGMGESNACRAQRKGFTRRATLAALRAHYLKLYADADGRIPATFQILTLTAWTPGETSKP